MFFIKYHGSSYKVYSVRYNEEENKTYFLLYGHNYEDDGYYWENAWFWLESDLCIPKEVL